MIPIREELIGWAPYGAPQLDVGIRLNTNENPYAPPPDVVTDLQRAVAEHDLNRYPDREALALREGLAVYLGHVPEGTWAANGSNEVIQQLLQLFGGTGRTALGFEPSYSMHSLIARSTCTAWASAPRDLETFEIDVDAAVAAVRAHRPHVTFLCSPNNPTGNALPHAVIEAVYDATDGMVVVDEAYAEFSHSPSAIALLPGRERLVVTRTMSKAFALAGARVGYLAADPRVVDLLRLVRLPYHLSSLTQAAALVALAHRETLLGYVDVLRSERDRLVASLPRTIPSDANFVLFGAADGTWQALLDRGVLVRDVGLSGWLRVTAGKPGENDAFLAALKEVT